MVGSRKALIGRVATWSATSSWPRLNLIDRLRLFCPTGPGGGCREFKQSSSRRAREGLVLTVGIELSAFKRAKIKNSQTSQQKSQQLFRNERCAYKLLSLGRPEQCRPR